MTSNPPPSLQVRLGAILNTQLAARFALLAVTALLVSVAYAIPPLMDWALGRNPAENLALERAVDNMTFYLATAGALALSVALAILAWSPPSRIPSNGLNQIMAMTGLVVVLSTLFHAGSDFNPRTLVLPACFGLLFWATVLAAPGIRQIRSVLLLLPVICVPVSLYALAQSQGMEILNYARVSPTGEEITTRQMVASTFGHPNYFASFLVPILPFAVRMALAPGSNVRRGLGWVCLFCLSAGLFSGGTRGAWLATICAAVPFYLVATLSPSYRRPLLFTGGLMVVTLVLVLIIPNPWLKVRFEVLDRLLASKEIVARFYYWTIALQMWADHVWFGVGYGNFNVLFWPSVAEFQLQPGSEYYQYVLAEMIRGVPPQFVHNDHLQVLTEHGLVGMGLWLGLWSLLAVQLWETAKLVRQDRGQLLLIGAFASSFVASAIDGLTNFPHYIPASGSVFYGLLALWICYRARVVGQWAGLTRPVAAPRPADTLVPELPRVRPTQMLRN